MKFVGETKYIIGIHLLLIGSKNILLLSALI